MDASKFSRTMAVLLTAVCLFFQQTLAFSLAKDFVIAQILYNILKPRIVPLPIPIPLPLKFVKHSFKPYAVPFYSHSLSAHQVGHSYDSTSGLGGQSGADYLSSDSSHLSSGHHHFSSSLSDISYGHDSLSSSLSEIPDLSTSYNLGHHDLSTSLSQISGFHLPSLPKTSYDHDLSIALSKLSAKDHDISAALSKYSTDDHNLSAALSKYSTDDHNLSAALSKYSTDDHNLSGALSKYSTKDYDLSSTLSKISTKKDFPKNFKSTPHNIQSILKELESESELLHEDSNHVDSIHDDIEAIGGLDILTDLDSLGENEKWW